MTDTFPSSGFEETESLLRRARAGDGASFGKLLRRVRPRLLGRIRLMMGAGAREAAESGDFLQSVFTQLVTSWDRYHVENDRQLLALATEIARNSIRQEVRRHRERAFSAFSASGILPPVDRRERNSYEFAAANEDCQRLADALELLPEDAREVIDLRHMEQLSFADIGVRMGRTENAVQLLHARALTRLARMLREGVE